ncbi:MAG: delta-aminolevulinic acid dehydratase [Ardenticatenaceae bacterium]|nr:delta-aminolevulinic acid dehydratase [Ardenticatenaceae bacterium]
MTDLIKTASQRLDAWIEREQFKGWDPYDALNSPLLKALTFGQRRIGQVWVQVMKRSPVNLRPLLGVPKGYNPKGMGLFLASYWRKYQQTGSQAHLEKVRFFYDWLRANASPGYQGACWGYNFDWPNRGFFAPAGTPTVVNTSFIALALLDVVPQFPAALDLAVSACQFFQHDLNHLRPRPDELCFSYTPLDERYIHNANILAAQVLAQVGQLQADPQLKEMAWQSARYTVHHQREDGSWLYGEGERDQWVDNFHTGFVLVALRDIARSLETAEFDTAVHAGYAYWKQHFFLPDGTPKYYADKLYPIDIHAVAQAVLTFLAFADVDDEAALWARKVAAWGIRQMQDSSGYFHFQIYGRYRSRVPYMRWCQAWMQRALTELEIA